MPEPVEETESVAEKPAATPTPTPKPAPPDLPDSGTGQWVSRDLDPSATARCMELIAASPHEVHIIGKLNQFTPMAWEPGLGMSIYVDGESRNAPLKAVTSPADHPGILQFQSDVTLGEIVCITYHRTRDSS